ncbi:glycosyltransferase family 4 protein [Pyruvatibacter mobilis]|uniref:glycosyltransferase family 4 protein n=1 Tax=Pyruvatibacter mobilis TaxID=1712261 RepID=UPI003C7B4713
MTSTEALTLRVNHRDLDILHVLRAPIGGLMRHVEDLVRGHVDAGHRVGLLCSSADATPATTARLEALAPLLALGLHKTPIRRLPSWSDLSAIGRVRSLVRHHGIDVVHGHGAKGGLLARLALPRHRDRGPFADARAVYTPHGGSLHYEPGSLAGLVFLNAERWLASRTDAFIFESLFAREAFAFKVGRIGGFSRIVHNGIGPDDFAPLPEAAPLYDIAFVGELRLLKGVEDLLRALAQLKGRDIKAVIAGDGPDRDYFKSRACDLGIAHMVTFPGMVPAREIFAQSRMLVVPSYAESLPYVVLEAAAAGIPLVATRVGGIPEIFGSQSARLVSPHDLEDLTAAISNTLDDPAVAARTAAELRTSVARHFSIGQMIDGVDEVYRVALQRVEGPYATHVEDADTTRTAVSGG